MEDVGDKKISKHDVFNSWSFFPDLQHLHLHLFG